MKPPRRAPPGASLATLVDRMAVQSGIDLRQVAEVQGVVDALTREMNCGATSAFLKGDVLVWHAGSPAQAAKLRNVAPTLTARLAARGIALGSVRVKIGAPVAQPDLRPSRPAAMPRPVLDAVQRLHDDSAEGPLRDALARVIERRKRR